MSITAEALEDGATSLTSSDGLSVTAVVDGPTVVASSHPKQYIDVNGKAVKCVVMFGVGGEELFVARTSAEAFDAELDTDEVDSLVARIAELVTTALGGGLLPTLQPPLSIDEAQRAVAELALPGVAHEIGFTDELFEAELVALQPSSSAALRSKHQLDRLRAEQLRLTTWLGNTSS